MVVSIHAPTWGATSVGIRSKLATTSFNPRTHMGCDIAAFSSYPSIKVSIHAPTWGATYCISIYSFTASTFQSTHPHGVRLLPGAIIVLMRSVSIHAPTWGATWRCCFFYILYNSFNPRTHMGCDLDIREFAMYHDLFQSTHPHGVRQTTRRKRCHRLPVSIHAPTWGATATAPPAINASPVSIHAPTWGATYGITSLSLLYCCFNPRTHMGCDFDNIVCKLTTIIVSIHAPTWGATSTFRNCLT